MGSSWSSSSLHILLGLALSCVGGLGVMLWNHDGQIQYRGSVGAVTPDITDHPSYNAVVDNYVFMHNAFRNDLVKLENKAKQGKDVTAAFEDWKDTLERHSKVEDEIFIPILQTRMKQKADGNGKSNELPNSIVKGTAHKEIETLIAKVETSLSSSSSSSAVPMAIHHLQKALNEHLQEEELYVMPNMLKYFSYRELWALDSFIINPKLEYCPPDVLVRITLWWFANLSLSEGWTLLKNFVRAGNQPEMPTEKWQELQRDIPVFHDVPIETLIS